MEKWNIGSRFHRRIKESDNVRLIDYIANAQGLSMTEIVEDCCPSDFDMDKYDDCDGCSGYVDDYEHNSCAVCWNKEINPKDIPHTCDTCRRYGKSDHNCYYCRHKERPDLWETKEKAHE